MTQLPKGWKISTLGALGAWGSGGTPSKNISSYYAGGSIPWLVIGDLNDGIVTKSKVNITEVALVNSSAKLLEKNTLLIGMYGSIGKLGITGVQCATNQAIAFCKPYIKYVELKYVFYALMSEKSFLVKKGQGGAQQNISQGILKAHEIPVAPLGEQKRIIDKLDAVFERISSCQVRLFHVFHVLKCFRQSVLSAATSGSLTEAWRLKQLVDNKEISTRSYLEENIIKLQEKLKGKRFEEILSLYSRVLYDSEKLPRGWVNCPVGMIGIVSNGSTPSRSDDRFWRGDIPWISSGEVRNCNIYKSNECISELGFESTPVRVLPRGSVLIAMIGEGKTRGQSAILEIEATVNQNVAAVVPFENGLISKYLWYSFQAKYEENRREGNGTGPQALNCQRVRELTLNLPPLAEQHEIVKRIEALFSFADRLEARLATACTAVDRLTPALLAKAFRGELVPQDPADEPASELLARLAASRAAETAKPLRARTAKV